MKAALFSNEMNRNVAVDSNVDKKREVEHIVERGSAGSIELI